MSEQSQQLDPAMLDLFRMEVEVSGPVITGGLLDMEKNRFSDEVAESLMRAAHSIKGAARMIGIEPVVRIAHIMEDCFVLLQKQQLSLDPRGIDTLLSATDLISKLANADMDTYNDAYQSYTAEIDVIVNSLQQIPSPGSDLLRPRDAGIESPATSSANQADNPMLPIFASDSLSIISDAQRLLSGARQSGLDGEQLDRLRKMLGSLRSGAKLVGLTTQVSRIDAVIAEINQGNFSTDTFRNHLHDIQAMITAATGVAPTHSATQAATAGMHTPDVEPVSNSASARDMRVSAGRLNRLVALAGESVVESRWVRQYANEMLHYKRKQTELINAIDNLRDKLDGLIETDYIRDLFDSIQIKANESRNFLGEKLSDLEEYDRRNGNLASRLNSEVLATRMRPFVDCTHGFPRMVRDIARSLGKQVELVIIGENTQVDRDILERIDTPLSHIIRNAIDHGIESPEQRLLSGKSASGKITVEAAHNMGMLSITVGDDGVGINRTELKDRIIERKLVSQSMAANLSEQELLDFIYLPGFSTRNSVTEVSGRGVGLDVVHSAIQDMRGQIRTSTTAGKGMKIQLLLPLTLAIIRSLIVEIGNQYYAFPLARIGHIHTLSRNDVRVMEDRQYFKHEDEHIGLIDAAQILEIDGSNLQDDNYPVIVIGDRNKSFGIVVNKFIGERELAVHQVDSRLGKIRDISAAALMEDGAPVLIIDVDDLIRSVDIMVSGERITKIKKKFQDAAAHTVKRILVVDDSITVREVERKLLQSKGYSVDVAVDGMDGWNTVRTRKYDLIISDIDMPRMNGIEMVTLIKNDPELRHLPVMIVSYKDREEDREAGLKAGADYYLTKGSFHDESLIEAVIDLIGEAKQ